ncbi:MAG: hypothetical protein JWP97_6511 [Labilithrix sp.]|nr:hypothetical protein [Labilithrix sp.]
MDWKLILPLMVVLGVVIVAVVIQRRGARQKVDLELSAGGAKAKLKSSVQAEMEGIKAGRNVKAIAGPNDPARMSNVEAGQDVIRDTTARDPKA